MNIHRRLVIVIAVFILAFGAIRPGFCAESSEIAKLQSYVFSMLNESEREGEVQGLLNADPQLANATTSDGEPILMWVINNLGAGGELARKSGKLAEMLIAKGADVNAVDRDGNPMLIRFAMFAQIPQIQFLTSHGVKVNAGDKEEGRTALHWVTLLKEFDAGETRPKEQVDKYLKVIELLRGAGADINARDKRGKTPLHNAAFLGNINMVELLLNKGADINVKDSDGYTPLGMVKSRLEEKWANANEKKPLPAVIEFLEKHGARDERPR